MYLSVCAGVAMAALGCAKSVNVEQEKSALMAADRDWSATTKDPNKFAAYYAADATAFMPGMPKISGAGPIKDAYVKMSAAPGFALSWTASRAEVAASGDIGYTVGAYQSEMGGKPEKGKYVTIWSKQTDGTWKVKEDIFNADEEPQAPASTMVMSQGGTSLTWGDGPPSLPPGAKLAVISGDPGKPAPYTVRLQFPAGYKIAAHSHPTDENVTVLSGTMALGMGDKFDDAALKTAPAGGYALLPAKMNHFAMAKTAATIQVHGVGPFQVNYVNPADDPSNAKK
jgi:ketosteroid isomerase-like protein